MRNLKVLTSLHQRIEDARGTQAVAVNYDTGTVYCATDKYLVAFNPTTGQVDNT